MGLGNSPEPRCHGLRHESQRPLYLWRRPGLRARGDSLRQRPARHPRRRFASRFSDRPPYGHALRLHDFIGLAARRRRGTASTKPPCTARPTISIFRTRGRSRPVFRWIMVCGMNTTHDLASPRTGLRGRSSWARMGSRPAIGIRAFISISWSGGSHPTGRIGAGGGRGCPSRCGRAEHTVWHAGAAITTRLPNLFQEDFDHRRRALHGSADAYRQAGSFRPLSKTR